MPKEKKKKAEEAAATFGGGLKNVVDRMKSRQDALADIMKQLPKGKKK